MARLPLCRPPLPSTVKARPSPLEPTVMAPPICPWRMSRLPVRYAAEPGIATPAMAFPTSPPAFLRSLAAQFTTLTAAWPTSASGGGATSNPVPVFLHPPITSVLLGGKNAVHTCPNNPSTGSPSNVPVYALNSCLSQNQTAQLAATVCTGTGACTSGSANDITCNAGHLNFIPQNTNVVSVDQNGVATAHLPGASVINATVAQATSTAGYFFTCPAKSIQLS